MKKDRADLAIRLVEERSRLGFSQSDFAGKVGMSREGLRLYEMGQRGMSAEFLAEAVALGVDVQYVLSGTRSRNLADVEATARGQSFADRGTIRGNVVGSVHAGGVVHQINTARHVTRTIAEVKPGETHISDQQAAELLGLVNLIVEKEALLKRDPRTHRSVWAALNSHCGVTKYRLIPKSEFARARKYLDQWMGRLSGMATAPVKDGDDWRKRKYAYIKINTKSSEDEAAVASYLKKNFGAASLTDLSNDELEQAYRYIAGRRSRSGKSADHSSK